MFTGIIETKGTVVEVARTTSGVRMIVQAPQWSYRPRLGDSVCVNGCCLTHAADAIERGFVFDIVPETLNRTNLGRLTPGSIVNLEHAATLGTLLGGHVVQGHIDAIADVVSIDTEREWRVRFRTHRSAMECMVPKGSVTIDGVSLTVADVDPSREMFDVALIPTTLEKTTLGDLRVGSVCNIETDAMARTIVHWLKHYRSVTG